MALWRHRDWAVVSGHLGPGFGNALHTVLLGLFGSTIKHCLTRWHHTAHSWVWALTGSQAPGRGTEVYQNIHKQINSRLEIQILGQAGIPQQSCRTAELPEAMCQGMSHPPSGCPPAASWFPEFWNDSPGWEKTPGQWTEANKPEEQRVVEGPTGRWTHRLGPPW